MHGSEAVSSPSWASFPRIHSDTPDEVLCRPIEASVLLSKGFLSIPDWLSERTDVPPGAKIVYGRILTYLRMGRSFPSREELSEKVGLGVRQVSNHLDLLIKIGILRVTRPSRAAVNNYALLDNELFQDFGVSKCKILHIRDERSCTSDVQDLSSSSEEERRRDKIHSSVGGVGAVPLRSTPDHPAGEFVCGGEAQVEKAGADFDAKSQDGVNYMSSDDRLDRARVSARAAADRTRRESLMREDKRKTKVQARFEGNDLFPAAARLQDVWRKEMARKYPDTLIPKWTQTEIGIAINLVKSANVAVAEDALVFTVRHWDRVFALVLGPKKPVQEAPSLRFLARNTDKILMVSQGWAKHRQTWERLDEWRRSRIDEYESMPDDLAEAVQTAKRAVSGFGF